MCLQLNHSQNTCRNQTCDAKNEPFCLAFTLEWGSHGTDGRFTMYCKWSRLGNVFKMVCGGRVGSILSNPLWSQYYTDVPIPVHCSNDDDVVIFL
jgi:hypothetical protein